MGKPETQEVVLEEAELEQIATKVGESLLPKLTETVKEQLQESADANKAAFDEAIAKLEPVAKKGVGKSKGTEGDQEDVVSKAVKKYGLEDVAKLSKEMRLFRAAKALADGDMTEVKRYNKYTRALRTKAGYANEADTEDGGALIPDPEFDTTVYENLPKYGVAFQYADVRQTTRTSVRFLSLDSGLEFYETAEAGVKRSAKMQFTKQLVDLIKYAVIVPSTDELHEDAAIDFWNLVTKELTRAYAKKADEVVFTHATSGITNTTGVITEPVSGDGTTITWDDLLTAEGKTEDDLDTSGFRWFMRKEVWFRLVQTKASGSGEYLFIPNPNQPATPWGTPVTFTRVLPNSTTVANNDAYAVYGDLSNYVLYNKKGMALKQLTEATIEDSEGEDFNLATQDGTAMRAVVRMLGKLPKGNASKFVIVGRGTVS